MITILKIRSWLTMAWQNSRSSLTDTFHQKWFKTIFFSALILDLLNFLFVYLMNLQSDRQLSILRYNVIFGANMIGDKREHYILPILGLLFPLVNLILATIWRKRGQTIVYLLIVGALSLNIVLTLAVYSIYLINLR